MEDISLVIKLFLYSFFTLFVLFEFIWPLQDQTKFWRLKLFMFWAMFSVACFWSTIFGGP